MKKLATVFLIAVLAPSLALAWLATRSVSDQELVVRSQLALLHQAETEELSSDITLFLDDVRIYYARLVDELVDEFGPDDLTTNFDTVIESRWSQALIGSVVTDDGRILNPSPNSPNPVAQSFIVANGGFLENRISAEVYRSGAPIPVELETEEIINTKPKFENWTSSRGLFLNDRAAKEKAPAEKVAVVQSKLRSANKKAVSAPLSESNDLEQKQDARSRTVELYSQIGNAPQQRQQIESLNWGNNFTTGNTSNWSALEMQCAPMIELIGNEPEGAISRFLEDGLHVLLWKRHPKAPGRVFWAELDLAALKIDLSEIVFAASRPQSNICLVLLDATGAVTAKTHPNFEADWRRPFVASEVGEILPHWEVAGYLLDPYAMLRSAGQARFTVWALVGVLLLAITIGTALVFRQIGREMLLARQKTDFVSNVSHELKTPLTSIRMFSELLGRPTEKQTEYAGVISTETARLTRLINNLLDFAKLDRKEANYEMAPINLVDLARQTVETYRPQIESEGITLEMHADDASVMVAGDGDALSQVLLNLLSNAEKYGNDSSIEVEVCATDTSGTIRVMDRGTGISRKEASRIFEKFYRVDDSLSSAKQGTGLGLTLARQIARAHGGDLTYRSRNGGGSCFELTLPLSP